VIDWSRIDRGKLNPLFFTAVENGFASLPDTWYATYGWRSNAEQAALYAKYKKGGPKAAPPGFSPHEFGLAIDVALDADAKRSGLQPNYDLNDPRWQAMIAMVQGSRWLHSGIGFGDGDHIEMVDWKSRARQ
jgi:hypothetical protein